MNKEEIIQNTRAGFELQRDFQGISEAALHKLTGNVLWGAFTGLNEFTVYALHSFANQTGMTFEELAGCTRDEAAQYIRPGRNGCELILKHHPKLHAAPTSRLAARWHCTSDAVRKAKKALGILPAQRQPAETVKAARLQRFSDVSMPMPGAGELDLDAIAPQRLRAISDEERKKLELFYDYGCKACVYRLESQHCGHYVCDFMKITGKRKGLRDPDGTCPVRRVKEATA